MSRSFFTLLLILNNLLLIFPQSLEDKLRGVLSDDFFQSTIIAMDVYDLASDTYLFRHNEKLLLRPASNMKLLTSVAGLKFLGTDYQFLTSLYYDGEIIGNTLFGNLYIEGGCDPEIRTENLTTFISALKALNIKSVSGNIIADISFKDSVYWGTGWMWDDDPSTDAPYLSALNINGNSVNIFVKGTNVGQPADINLVPDTEFFTITNKTQTVLRKDEENFFITRNWFLRRNEIIATGKVSLEKELKEDGDKQVNVMRPELYFLTLFKETLVKSGISVSGALGIAPLPLLNKYITSVPTSLMTVLQNVNKNSNNLSAEMVLYALGEKNTGRPAKAENGIKAVNELIALVGHQAENYRIVDGSGVSHYNLISAELITDILKYIYKNEQAVYDSLLLTLPVAGVDGTLSKRMTNSSAFNNVRAKTGTLSGVNALSGYIRAANGNRIAFSILIQNHVDQSARARALQDIICNIIAEHR